MTISVEQIDALLPQTQCTQCGYEGCLPYATAIAAGAPHNQCPPGGKRVIAELSALLQRPILPLNPANGIEKPKVWAYIREIDCIGCTKCLQACPTDAIVGSAKMMHTVIQQECTGCGLCVTPCPVDCIELMLTPESDQPEHMPTTQRISNSNRYRQRHYAHNARQIKYLERQHNQFKIHQLHQSGTDPKVFVQQALARAQAEKSSTIQVSKP